MSECAGMNMYTCGWKTVTVVVKLRARMCAFCALVCMCVCTCVCAVVSVFPRKDDSFH